MMTDRSSRIKWHQLFGSLLQELLTPVGVTVETEVNVTGDPPKVDILLLRRETGTWTEEQRQYLPDGIRDSSASHILLEFKYTESLNQTVIETVAGYDVFYRQGRSLFRADVQSFIVSAKTPRRQTLTDFGYRETQQEGLYQSDNILLAEIPLLILNQLSNEPHNVFFKLFASRRGAKLKAITGLRQWWLSRLSKRLYWLIRGLSRVWFTKGAALMEEITVEGLIEEGKTFKEVILPLLAVEELEEVLRDTPYVRQVREEGREEGRAEGREAIVKTISHILTIRFQIEPDHFVKVLSHLSLPILEMLSEVALTADNLTTFEARLQQAAGSDQSLEHRSD